MPRSPTRLLRAAALVLVLAAGCGDRAADPAPPPSTAPLATQFAALEQVCRNLAPRWAAALGATADEARTRLDTDPVGSLRALVGVLGELDLAVHQSLDPGPAHDELHNASASLARTAGDLADALEDPQPDAPPAPAASGPVPGTAAPTDPSTRPDPALAHREALRDELLVAHDHLRGLLERDGAPTCVP